MIRIKLHLYCTGLFVMLMLMLSMHTNAFSDYSTNLAYIGYIQDGSGDIDVGNYSVPVVYDWNSDGKKDLLVGQNYHDGTASHGYVTYFENQGTNASPSFGSGTYIESCAPCSSLDVAAGG
jgi:hypothetical protein